MCSLQRQVASFDVAVHCSFWVTAKPGPGLDISGPSPGLGHGNLEGLSVQGAWEVLCWLPCYKGEASEEELTFLLICHYTFSAQFFGYEIRPWSVDSLGGGFVTSPFRTVGRSKIKK